MHLPILSGVCTFLLCIVRCCPCTAQKEHHRLWKHKRLHRALYDGPLRLSFWVGGARPSDSWWHPEQKARTKGKSLCPSEDAPRSRQRRPLRTIARFGCGSPRPADTADFKAHRDRWGELRR